MPVLEPTEIKDLTTRLESYLQKLTGYGKPIYLNAGGSAAVYKVNSKSGLSVFKVFSPKLFNGSRAAAEKRRLEVQRRLMGHNCSSLVQTLRVEETEGTAFMEMEFISWPQLTTQLQYIPDELVGMLIMQLVTAVRFLEGQGVVHRDIKPENIHISSDFKQLKLLDLGVVREFELTDSEDASITDHGNIRPFLATAQYSSPEYLFRLDEPSSRLWKGLNFYQIGAVLHDLIMKKPLFQNEMSLGNRWLVARAVLAKTPSFADGAPTRLASLKALATRCLVKDLDIRLQLVGWDDFILESTDDPLAALRGRLAKREINAGAYAKESTDGRLQFDRGDFSKRFMEGVRSELIATCGARLPLALLVPPPNTASIYKLRLTASNVITIDCNLNIKWAEGFYSRTATVELAARLVTTDAADEKPFTSSRVICTAVILEGEAEAIHSSCKALAVVISQGLDLIDGTDNPATLNGVDLLLPKNK